MYYYIYMMGHHDQLDHTSKLNSKPVIVLLSRDLSLIFPFHILPSPVHPTGFSFCFFPDFLAIFILSLNSIKYNMMTAHKVQHIQGSRRPCTSTRNSCVVKSTVISLHVSVHTEKYCQYHIKSI